MPALDRAASLQSLLLTPGIHRGLAPRPVRRLATGNAALDAWLDGGLPLGRMSAIVGGRSCGKTTLGYAVAAPLTAAGSCVAWIDVADAFDPEHAAAAGMQLRQVLWVRPPDVRVALRAAEHVLETGGFTLVLLDVDDAIRRDGATRPAAWLRLTRAVAASSAAVVVLTGAALQIAAAVSLEMSATRIAFVDAGGAHTLFDGFVTLMTCRHDKLGPTRAAPTPLRAATA